MFISLLRQSFVNQKKAMALMVLAVAVGTTVSASLITISLDIQGKVSKELRSFGANITIEPKIEGFADIAGQRRFLRQEDMNKAKTIFWRHNILGLAPFLDSGVEIATPRETRKAMALGTWLEKDLPVPGESATFKAGVVSVSPWWEVDGTQPGPDSVLIGSTLAMEMGISKGDEVKLNGRPYKVSGLLLTGGTEDSLVIMDLSAMQLLINKPGAISRVQVSALTTPMDDFAYKSPESMSKQEYEKWYCTGYVTSIARQLEEVFAGSRAKPIWQVAETEGNVLGRMSVLIYLLTAAALVASALGMSTTMAATLLSRLDEIALMKALGADTFGVSYIFLAEALLIGLMGGVLGYLASLGVSDYIGVRVFGGPMAERDMLLPVALLSALVISALGSMLPIRRALRVKPAIVLKEAH